MQNAFEGSVGTFTLGVGGLLVPEPGPAGVALQFAGAVVAVVTLRRHLVQPVDHPSSLLNLERVVERVHRQGCAALDAAPDLPDAAEGDAAGAASACGRATIGHDAVGVVRSIDERARAALAEARRPEIELLVAPGDHADRLHPVGRVAPAAAVQGVVRRAPCRPA